MSFVRESNINLPFIFALPSCVLASSTVETRKGFLNISHLLFGVQWNASFLPPRASTIRALKQRHCGKLFITSARICRQLIPDIISSAGSWAHVVDYTAQPLTVAYDGFAERENEQAKTWQAIKKSTMEMLALKMSLWVMHFLYAISSFFLHGGSERENHHPDELPTRLSSPCGFTFRRPDSQVFAALSINNLEGAENIYVRQRCWGDLETRRKTS